MTGFIPTVRTSLIRTERRYGSPDLTGSDTIQVQIPLTDSGTASWHLR